MAKVDLRAQDLARICQLARETLSPGTEIRAYGSRIKGTNHDASDLDLTVLAAPELDEQEGLEQVDLFHEALVESCIPIIVQVSAWSRLPLRFQQRIDERYEVLIVV